MHPAQSRTTGFATESGHECGHVAVLHILGEPVAHRCQVPSTMDEDSAVSESVPVGGRGEGPGPVIENDEIIRCVYATLPALTTVFEEEPLEIRVTHLSVCGVQKSKKDALTME